MNYLPSKFFARTAFSSQTQICTQTSTLIHTSSSVLVWSHSFCFVLHLFVEVRMYRTPVWAQHMVAYFEKRWFSQHGWILVVQVPALQLSGWTIRAKMTDYTATRSERIGQGPVEHLRVPREISPFPRMQWKPELDLLEEGFHPDPVSSSPSSWMEGFAEPLQGHAPELQFKSLRGPGFWKGSLSSYSSTV